MASVRLTACIVNTAYRYNVLLNDQETVGALARYLSQQEGYVDTSTLELARPVSTDQHLQDIDIQTGDRLLLVTQPPEASELPAPLAPGDKILRFSLGEYTVSSRGKKSLLIGKPDEGRKIVPDVDLRNFVPPRMINFVSRECLKLTFDDRQKRWYAARAGQTRVLIDEFELPNDQPIPFDGNATLRFYRANDDPKNPSTSPVGEIRVTIEAVASRDDVVYLAAGNKSVNVQVGIEKEVLKLNASSNMNMDYLVSGLLAYNNIPPTPETRLWLVRLVSPETPLQRLNLNTDEFLYASRQVRYAQNLLILCNIHDRSQTFELTAGLGDDEKLIGRRSQAEVKDNDLDVDLFDAVVKRADDPETYRKISRRQARILYKASENTWWMRLEQRTSVPAFINNTRITSTTPIQLTSGDVLSIGPTVDDYFARLEVEIVSKSD